jgi:sulfatase maturation enzyme AslB (radical SAM superfamily)
MGSGTATAVIEAARGCRLFAVTGGEPLLAPDVTFRLLESVESPSVMFTNGTLLDPPSCRRLGACGASLLVSLDGSADRHDPMRPLSGGGGSWIRTASGLDAAAAEGISFGISIVLREHNTEGLGDTLDFLLERFGPASFGVNLLHFTGHGFDGPAPAEYAGAVLEAYRFARRTGIYIDQVARRLTPVVTGIPRYRDCEAMGGKTVFFPDGSRSCCVNWLGREDPPPEWSWRIPLLAGECSGCPAICVCGGGCAWDGENLAGPGSMDPRNCVWTLALLEEILSDIAAVFPEGYPSRSELAREFAPLLPDRSRVLSTSMGHTE